MKIGFIGLGLIGGSIARAIRYFYPDAEIIASSRTRATLEQAVTDGVIDRIQDTVDEAFADCKYIFLCAPVSNNAEYLEQLKSIIRPSCIITDVGSTKCDIHAKVTELGLEANFIGGHPMAGSEKTGYANSKRILIENAYYIITPSSQVPEEEVARYRDFVESLKALPLVLDYRTHDYVTAGISHLPHIIASSLVNLVKDSDTQDGIMKLVAAGGFKDITRIASSSPEMWEQICMTNRENISSILNDYIASLTHIKQQLDEAQSGAIYHLFETSRDYRNSLPVKGNGPIQRIYEIYCDMVDEAGGIATLATILASNQINLKNIGIVHSREFIEAVLRIEFYDEYAMKHAAEILRRYRYVIYER
ncbi:MAG: prephenate dehydrogenase [Lachnospiraceae bacterium]|nr:prephenate dehydrogenase [Lachnospiraceae bacterium]